MIGRSSLLRIGLALALSAAAQVAIVAAPRSWFHKLAGSRGDLAVVRTQTALGSGGRAWLIDLFQCGFAGEVLYAGTNRERDAAMARDAERLAAAVPVSASIAPGWTSLRREGLPRGEGSAGAAWLGYSIEERAEGWPWRCVRGEKHIVRTEASSPPFGRQAQVSRRGYILLPRDIWIPCLPIWGGLALDLAALAIPFAAVHSLVGRLRAAHRRRRGLCPACRYDLAGLGAGAPCPECGSARPNE